MEEDNNDMRNEDMNSTVQDLKDAGRKGKNAISKIKGGKTLGNEPGEKVGVGKKIADKRTPA